MPKKIIKNVATKSKNTERTNVIKLKVSQRELKQLQSLAALTNMDISKVIRACVKQSAGTIRKNYLRDFVGRTAAMPEPFDNSPLFLLDETDRGLAEQTPHLPAANLTPEEMQAVSREAAARLEKIFWLMDGPDDQIPAEYRNDVEWWREHEAEGRRLLNRQLAAEYPYLM